MNTDHRTTPAKRAQMLIDSTIEGLDAEDALDGDTVYEEAMKLAEEIHCYQEVEPYIDEATSLMDEQKKAFI